MRNFSIFPLKMSEFAVPVDPKAPMKPSLKVILSAFVK
jgi:hypothetical protein